MQQDIRANMPESMVEDHDSWKSLEEGLYEISAYLKGENAIRNKTYAFKPYHIRKLDRMVDARCSYIRKKFKEARR